MSTQLAGMASLAASRSKKHLPDFVIPREDCFLHLVACVGSPRFYNAFADILRTEFRVDQFSAFRLQDSKLEVLTHRDCSTPWDEAEAARIIHSSLCAAVDGILRVTGARAVPPAVLAYTRVEGAAVGVVLAMGSVLNDRSTLHRHMYPLLVALGKHAEVICARTRIARPLGSLRAIEECIESSDLVSGREAQVCARILYGMSSTGISLDLCISEGTVRTYRKRAYQRLAIGSERELLNWFLAHHADS